MEMLLSTFVQGVESCTRNITVVRQDMQGKGLKLINLHRLIMMKRAGIYSFKFKTNKNEKAVNFWLKQGAKIMDVKGEDYEMEIKIKKE